jgi:hypothetical protein
MRRARWFHFRIGHLRINTTLAYLLPSPFLSLWCSPDNMPASHAGDHRSEAGQGRQFRRVVHGEQQTRLIQNQAALDVQFVSRRPIRPQSIVSDAFAR